MGVVKSWNSNYLSCWLTVKVGTARPSTRCWWSRHSGRTDCLPWHPYFLSWWWESCLCIMQSRSLTWRVLSQRRWAGYCGMVMGECLCIMQSRSLTWRVLSQRRWAGSHDVHVTTSWSIRCLCGCVAFDRYMYVVKWYACAYCSVPSKHPSPCKHPPPIFVDPIVCVYTYVQMASSCKYPPWNFCPWIPNAHGCLLGTVIW